VPVWLLYFSLLLLLLFNTTDMSRAIQRLMKDYRKAEKLVGRSSNEPFADLANAATVTSQTYAQQMAQLRRDPELTQDEKKYLVAVERKITVLS
jgi:Na+-transporting methylmalonyl-CoA/oxaloacetate decarboxylase gamma subunit